MISVAADIDVLMGDIGRNARDASRPLARAGGEVRNAALVAVAKAIAERRGDILAANSKDVADAKSAGLTAALLDRLQLDDERITAIERGVVAIAELADPLDRVLAEWTRPNGLVIRRVAVPLGVIGIVYESRPNVTADAAALCLKSGNAVILRGGSESFRSSMAIFDCVRHGLMSAGLPEHSVQMVPTRDRDAVGFLLSSMADYVDVVVPRGGKRLIQRVQQEARIPVIGHLEGICHVYVNAAADPAMAEAIAVNAKMRRTGICGAAETILVDRAIAPSMLPRIGRALLDAGCEVRGDAEVMAAVPGASPATSEDWSTEYLDAIVSVRTVADIDAAIEHIEQFGSGHTDSIVTNDEQAAAQFCAQVDSAIVLHNASTQFADGGEFGMGAEIGIATGKIHARGPVGAEQLTSYKYVVGGNGQVRS